ncbi:MAG: pantoate--beta-alanine ligase [Marmoricola sp.]
MTSVLQRVETRDELAAALAAVRAAGARVGFVPTMGALHEGHRALVRRAREEVGPEGVVVVSVFVNPLQFGPGEDLDRYPRTLAEDLEACAAEGVDVVLTPAVAEVYPNGVPFAADDPQVTVDPGPLADLLEGASRPGHFRGVLTVVAKLFGLVRPDVAVFGQKDYQQLALIRRMAADLCLGTDVVGAETVREPDGLALSSRNRYLDADQRREAVVLSRALMAARDDAGRGVQAALDAARAELRASKGVDLDYLEVTDPDLGPAPERGEARMLIAARLGTTRLIDNIALTLGTGNGDS